MVHPLATTAQLEYAARSSMRGNFFTVNLDDVRAPSKLPWVRRADVRQRWRVPSSAPGGGGMWRPPAGVSGKPATMRLSRRDLHRGERNARMPIFSGRRGLPGCCWPSSMTSLPQARPLGKQLVSASLSAREAWQLKMEDG